MQKAADKGVSSAYFYLGLMNLEGDIIEQNFEKALDYYERGAAKNNAYCFYELSRIYSEGIKEIDLAPDPVL